MKNVDRDKYIEKYRIGTIVLPKGYCLSDETDLIGKDHLALTYRFTWLVLNDELYGKRVGDYPKVFIQPIEKIETEQEYRRGLYLL